MSITLSPIIHPIPQFFSTSVSKECIWKWSLCRVLSFLCFFAFHLPTLIYKRVEYIRPFLSALLCYFLSPFYSNCLNCRFGIEVGRLHCSRWWPSNSSCCLRGNQTRQSGEQLPCTVFNPFFSQKRKRWKGVDECICSSL